MIAEVGMFSISGDPAKDTAIWLASFESTFHQYVETHQESCICRVFRIITLSIGEQTLQYHYYVR